MARIAQLVTDLVYARMLDAATGFNFWINQLTGGADYPDIPGFQLTDQNPQSILLGSFDEALIDDAALFTDYPACVLRATSGNSNALRMTPTIYSGPVVVVVDLYSSTLKDAISTSLSEHYQDLFLDAMLETFNRSEEYGNYVTGIAYNNDISWQRGPLRPGGYEFRQKSRFVMSFNLPMVAER